MSDLDEPTPGYGAWEEWWMSLMPEQQAEEIRLMDEHVAFTEVSGS